MRTVVQVWVPVEDRPPPSNLSEALGVAARAARAGPSRAERLLALRLALLDRYPLVPAAEGEPSVWADDALAQERPGPSWDIAITPPAAYEVRPYVVALAGRFGLDACDREAGEAWLASGEAFSHDDRGPCVAALAAWRQGDFVAAHDALCELAQAGNASALWHLGTLYDEGGGFVQCNALIACALFGMALAVQDAAGPFPSPAASTPAAGTAAGGSVRPAFDRAAFTQAYRERIGPEMSAAADDLQARLLEPGAFRAGLRDAGGPRDTQFAQAMEALARGDVAGALRELLPLADQGHVDAQRSAVRLWTAGEAAPPDARRELDWTRVAAQAGDDAGMWGLATLCDEGVLLPRDAPQAAHWLRRLVRRGRTAAMRDAARERLAHLERVAARRPDPAPETAPAFAAATASPQWWREGVRRRDPQALVHLGRSLAFGYEEQRDRVAAQALFVMASRLGAARAPFLAPELADPRAVRHLLALIGDQGDPLALVESRQVAIDDDDPDAPPGDDDGDVIVRARDTQAGLAPVAAALAQRAAVQDGPTVPASLEPATAPIGFAPVTAPIGLAVSAPDSIVVAAQVRRADAAEAPPELDSLRSLRSAFEHPLPSPDEQHVALRRAGVALVGGILLAVMAVLWAVSFGWLGSVALFVLAGACACRAAVPGARIAGDSPAEARAAAVLAFVPVAGQALAALLMHRAGRALRGRMAPSERAARAWPGRSRQRLRSRAARAGSRLRVRP